jgi:hypothetical protein
LTCLSDSVKSLSRPCAYVVTFRASLPDLLFPFLLGQNSRLGGSRPEVVNRSRQDASEVPQKDIYVPGASHRGGGHKVPPPLFHTHFSQRGNGREGGYSMYPPSKLHPKGMRKHVVSEALALSKNPRCGVKRSMRSPSGLRMQARPKGLLRST